MTIKEIAEAAGVSRGTVDRVLHNRGGVAPEVAKRVREMALEMGYIPNKAGKMLAARKQPLLIGCLLPSLGNVFFQSVIEGIRRAESELCDFGVDVMIREVRGYNTAEHIEAMKALVDAGCGALCVSTVDAPEIRTCINRIIEKGIPVIAVTTDISETERLCYVGSNYRHGGEVTAGMLALCTKEKLNILIVTGSRLIKGHNERVRGLMLKLKEKEVPFRLVKMIESQDDDERAYLNTSDAIEKYPQTNCVCVIGAGVYGVCKAIMELEKKPSDHFWLSCFDDIPTTRELIANSIIDFTVCQQGEEQGYQAIQLMFNYILQGKKELPKDYYTKTMIKISENLKDDGEKI